MTGIIGAMDVEVDALKKAVENPSVSVFGGIEYVTGKIENENVCIAQCSPGKVNAALCAQIMLDCFDVECIINTGIGCSLSENVKIKNVVIASDVCQYDIDTTGCGDPKGYISGLGVVKLDADKDLSSALFQAAEACNAKAYLGTVASGDTFIASSELKKSIAEDFGAICGEMEGGAIGQVCFVNSVPFAVIRCISDGGDENSQIAYPVFKKIAAENSAAIITSFIKNK